jgi:hypothetical protein
MMRWHLGWAVGHNPIALPIAAVVFESAFGLVLRHEVVARRRAPPVCGVHPDTPSATMTPCLPRNGLVSDGRI